MVFAKLNSWSGITMLVRQKVNKNDPEYVDVMPNAKTVSLCMMQEYGGYFKAVVFHFVMFDKNADKKKSTFDIVAAHVPLKLDNPETDLSKKDVVGGRKVMYMKAVTWKREGSNYGNPTLIVGDAQMSQMDRRATYITATHTTNYTCCAEEADMYDKANYMCTAGREMVL